jgi:regulatory protein YycI of two-component signal transduction system YycFG
MKYSVVIYENEVMDIDESEKDSDILQTIPKAIERKVFRSKKLALEHKFIRSLEGYYTQIFYLEGYDSDGDELWEQL